MGAESAVDPEIYSYAMGIVISAIIVVSIFFEMVEERSLEGAKEWQRPVIAAMFSELTILGFIGLVMFTTTKLGKQALDDFVCHPETGLFRHDEESCLSLVGINASLLHVPEEFLEQGYICLENPLIELTENAHMTLFLIMMIFLVIVVLNVTLGRKNLDFYRMCEDECVIRSLDDIVKAERQSAAEARASVWNLCPCVCRCVPMRYTKRCGTLLCRADLVDEHHLKIRHLKFAAARTSFIKGQNDAAHSDEHKLDSHFDFTVYLSQQMSEKLTEIVELSVGNWISIWLIFMMFVAGTFVIRTMPESDGGAMEDGAGAKLPLILSCGALILVYVSYACIILLHVRLDAIEDVLVHPGHLRTGHPFRAQWEKDCVDQFLTDDDTSSTDSQSPPRAPSKAAGNIRVPLLNSHHDSLRRTAKEGHGQAATWGSRRRSSLPNIANLQTSKNPESPLQRRHSLTSDQVGLIASVRNTAPLTPNAAREAACQRAGLRNTIPIEEQLYPRFKYDSRGKPLPKPPKDCLGRSPSHQEYLFGGLSHGHHFIYQYLTSTMLMLALYTGIMIVNFSGPALHWCGSWSRAIPLFLVAAFPIGGHFVEFSMLLPKLLLVTSIQEFASGELTAKTTHIMRSRKALRILSYACAISDASRLALKVRAKGLRGATFSKLSTDEQAALEAECRVKTFGMGEVCVSQGGNNDHLHVIVSGSASVEVKGKQVAVLKAPQEFGLLSLLNNTPCTATVRAQGTLVCYLLERSIYDKYFAKKSKLAMVVASSESSMKNAVREAEGGGGESPQRGAALTQKASSKAHGRQASLQHLRLAATKVKDEIHTNHSFGTNSSHDGPALSSSRSLSGAISPSVVDHTSVMGEGGEEKTFERTKSTFHGVVRAAQAAKHISRVVETRRLENELRKKGKAPKSFAERVKKGGRKSEAISAYRRAALVDLFCQIDSDLSGSIDEDEMLEFLSSVFAPATGDGLNEHEMRQVKLMIAGLDTDGDGSIDLGEFLSVMEPIVTQMEEEETPEMISARIWDVLDEDGEGEIEISEFRNVLMKVGLEMSYDEVRELFSEFDEDGSGALDFDELVCCMKAQV